MALYEAKALGRNRCVLFRQPEPDLRNAAE
jgi:hypothetical protein